MSGPLILALALALDAMLGEPRWLWSRLPHPAVLMGRLIAWAEARFNDHSKAAGVLTLVGLVAVAWGAGMILASLGGLVELLAAAILLAHRSLIEHVRSVAQELRLSLPAGRAAVARIVSRDTAEMSEPDVCRAAMESAAENLSDGVMAPAFWFLVAGLPGMAVYKMVNTADSMIGYKTERYAQFGWAAARFDDLLNWIPARLTAGLLWLAGQGWRLTDASGAIGAEARRHKSPNAGWPEAVLARTTGVALAGPRRYHGQLQDLPWVNPDGLRTPGAAEVEESLTQLWRAWGIFVILCLCLSLTQ